MSRLIGSSVVPLRSVPASERGRDIVTVERTHELRGRHHVLQGTISPTEGIAPEQLRVRELMRRVDGECVTEVIIASNPNIEGEATAM